MKTDHFIVKQGELPVILSVRHDGYRKTVGGKLLPLRTDDQKRRDINTRFLAESIYKDIFEKKRKKVSLIINTVQRRYETDEMIQRYDEAVKKLVTSSQTFPVLLLDIHGFSSKFSLGSYDMILGTDHRNSLGSSNIDTVFTVCMAERGYRVYCPSKEQVEGELFGATTMKTLVKRSTKWNIPNLISMQIEVYRDFRVGEEGKKKGKQLAVEISNFLLNNFLK